MENNTTCKSYRTKEIRLYNLIFPLYMLMLLSPVLWVVMIAGNFVIDSLVLYAACRKTGDFKRIWKKSILKVFLAGFGADWLGCLVNTIVNTILFMFVLPCLPSSSGLSAFFTNINPYFWPENIVAALPALILAGLLIYWFNARFTLKKSGLPLQRQKKIALYLAVFTAPYVMFVPYDLLNRIFGGY